MKARLIQETQRVNHAFKLADKRAAEAAGERYDIPQFLTNEIGTEISGPLVWALCCPGHLNAPPVAEPVDEACRKKVDHWMTVERPKALAAIREMAKPANLKKMKKESRQEVEALAEAYADETTTEETA